MAILSRVQLAVQLLKFIEQDEERLHERRKELSTFLPSLSLAESNELIDKVYGDVIPIDLD